MNYFKRKKTPTEKLDVGMMLPFIIIFWKTRNQFFISSFLAFEVLLDDILGLRFFAIVLKNKCDFTKIYKLPSC